MKRLLIRSRLLWAFAGCGVLCHATSAQRLLVVDESSVNHPRVLSFAPCGGPALPNQPFAALCPEGSCNARTYNRLRQGPDRMLYLVRQYEATVERYHPDTGTHLGTVVNGFTGSSGLRSPRALAVGRNNVLYVTSEPWQTEARILAFDPTSGALLRTVAQFGTWQTFDDILVAPDDTLVVSGTFGVRRLDAVTGATLTTYPLYGGNLAIAPDGDLLVANVRSLSLVVYEMGFTTGVQQRIVMSNLYGAANDIALGPSGTLIVCSGAYGNDPTTMGIRSFDLATGTLLGNYVPSGIADRPISMLFQQTVPTQGVSLFGTASGPRPACITALSTPAVGNAMFAVSSVASPPSAPGLLFLGPTPLTAPLPAVGIDFWLHPGMPLTLFPVVSDTLGQGTVALPIPPYPQLVGARLFGQFVWFGAPAFSATQGLAIQIMP